MADQVDQLLVETQIEIVRKAIKKWTGVLNHPDAYEELLILARSNVDREERNLQKLKDKYPEYFI
jgi:hypothetical protein